jgi:hypothetical protein
MPIEIGHLISKRKPLVVEWEGERVNLAYRPYTLAIGQAITDALREGDRTYVVEEMERLLIEWDITEEGEPLPIDAESLGRLPLELLNAISRAILEEMYPNRKSGGATAAS